MQSVAILHVVLSLYRTRCGTGWQGCR